MLIYWPIKRFAQTFWHWLLESNSAQFQSAQCQIDLLGSRPSETVDQRAGEIVPPSTGCDAGRLGGGPVGQSSLPASICRTQVELHFGGFPPAQDTWSISRLIAIIHQHVYVIILGNDNNKKKKVRENRPGCTLSLRPLWLARWGAGAPRDFSNSARADRFPAIRPTANSNGEDVATISNMVIKVSTQLF